MKGYVKRLERICKFEVQ